MSWSDVLAIIEHAEMTGWARVGAISSALVLRFAEGIGTNIGQCFARRRGCR